MPRGTTTQRGYGWAHQQARTQALERMPDGQPCTRCAQPMYRNEAQLLDLDHNEDRRTYRGLAHRTCNRRAGQAKAQARRRARVTTSTNTRRRAKPINSRKW
ncbi:endonuclease domain-containing protein [Micromonospora sp. NPDC005113]